jgi:2-methylcitrate dehydratase PrpD
LATDTTSPGTGAPDFAQIYAEYSATLAFADLPAAAVAAAKLNVFDTLACSIAGFTATGVPELRDIVCDWGGKPEASVLWSDIRVPAPHAAWVNGSMAHARDYDDTHDTAVLHAGVSVIPAAIAAAEMAGARVSGKDFYAAVVAGLELICRLGMATRSGVMETGFIYTSLFGYFGATVAAARILRLSPVDTVNAIGIAFSQAAGTHQVTRDAAWTKRMQPGFAARAALASVVMARKGVRGVQRTFEGEDGVDRIYLRSSLDAAVLRDRLGTHYWMEDLSYKPYPCCRFNHTAIDAALLVRAQPGFDWRKVSEIRAFTNSQGNQAVGTPLEIRRAPTTVVQAQFSICYTIACALVNGTVGLADFMPEALSRKDILALTARVTPLVDAEIERRWGRNISPTRVEAVVGDRVHSAQVDVPKGSRSAPMSREDIRRKLDDCLVFGGFDKGGAGLFEQAIERLQDCADVAADIRALIAGVRGGVAARLASNA